MAIKPQTWMRIIKAISEENGFNVSPGLKSFTIKKELDHSVAFKIDLSSSEYIEVSQWETIIEEGEGDYGRAVYSIRNISELIHFCTILMNSEFIRARR